MSQLAEFAPLGFVLCCVGAAVCLAHLIFGPYDDGI